MIRNIHIAGGLPLLLLAALPALADPALSVEPAALAFSYVQNSAPAKSQLVVLHNAGEQDVVVSVSASGGSWLSMSPASLTVPAGGGAPVSVVVNASGLAPGTYPGTVTMTAHTGETASVAVVTAVSSATQSVIISQTGLRFQVAAGASPPLSQPIVVLKGGGNTINLSAVSTTLSGGRWLASDVNSIANSTAVAGNVNVRVNPTTLDPGDYYGTVEVMASGSVNTSQTTVVVLNVLPPDADPGPVATPSGLVFIATQGAANPARQTVTVANASNRTLHASAAIAPGDGPDWFTVTPANATITSTSPAQFRVDVNMEGLQAGTYSGSLEFRFDENTVVLPVQVLLIVTPPATPTLAASRSSGPQASACNPGKLLPVMTLFNAGSAAGVGWPTSLDVQVNDDCGSPLLNGSVLATFSSGDPALPLTSNGNGHWSGTWQARAASAQVGITVWAQTPDASLAGSTQTSGSAQVNANSPPVIDTAGVVSSASFSRGAPLAPGSLITIFGAHLAGGDNKAGETPLPVRLGSTQASIGPVNMPLFFASDGQVNAIMPYDAPMNGSGQVFVRRDSTLSMPAAVIIATAQPAILSKDGSGHGAGMVEVVKPDGTRFAADTDHPAAAGDGVIIYCSGLGQVDRLFAAGGTSPAEPPLNASNKVTVTIGGQPAPVTFAGLAPHMVGVYRVDATVPTGIESAPDVPVVMTAAGLSSEPVTIPIQ